MTKTSFVKQELRVQQQQKLRGISEEKKRLHSNKIVLFLQQSIVWKEAKSVVAFLPFLTEPRILPLLDLGLAQKKSVFIPRTHRHPQDLQHYDTRTRQNQALKSFRNVYSSLSLLAEAQRCTVPVETVSYQARSLVTLRFPVLLLVPGLVFSRAGGRLGRGWAFYDRLLALAHVQSWKVGVCYDLQISGGELPQESHDVRMQYLASESGVRACLS